VNVNVKESVTALVLLALAGFAWIDTISLAGEARVFPRAVATIMGILATLMLARAVFKGAGAEDKPFFKSFGTFLVCLALIFGYIFCTEAIGYFSASVVFVPAFALLLGLRKPLVIVLTTVIFIIAVHLVFVEAFDRPLPREFFQRH